MVDGDLLRDGFCLLPGAVPVETVRQLTGKPLGQAVPNARLGLVSGFGMVAYDRCLCTGALILASEDCP